MTLFFFLKYFSLLWFNFLFVLTIVRQTSLASEGERGRRRVSRGWILFHSFFSSFFFSAKNSFLHFIRNLHRARCRCCHLVAMLSNRIYNYFTIIFGLNFFHHSNFWSRLRMVSDFCSCVWFCRVWTSRPYHFPYGGFRTKKWRRHWTGGGLLPIIAGYHLLHLLPILL